MRLATRSWGSGARRIQLVHGINGTSELWHDFAELLAARHDATVTAVDLRGHGGSAHAEPGAYRVADFADDLVETLEPGADRVIGHSLGGRVLATAVERLRPARAVYLDPGFRLALTPRSPLGWALEHLPGTPAALAWLFTRGTPGLDAENRARFARSSAAWDRRMVRPVFVELMRSPLPVAPPAVPSTVVRGPDSILVRPGHAHELAAAGWEVRDFPGAKHDMATLDPAGTEALLRDRL
ncbi:alpha/beta fold hydrolase [Homoserinibacter sp. YIM 151385]|uniref:alpha/beta fold hydrolase n=1 Tax=Homoserinibacter sp. YIM 151385 TaxID=2985506 RepID=UPI0022F09744|nr:alpha/beta fold hydrolase [Homoserinibacter sp. YIM 151385]WBU39134.1 alpha/beta fold hydrolase [Homoserinibacter sp. YIM 151385]